MLSVNRFAYFLFGKKSPSPKPIGGFEQTYYYNDLRCFVGNVNRLIHAGRGIDDELAKESVQGTYPVLDLVTCLSHYKKVEDRRLKGLLGLFVQNMLTYASCYFVIIRPSCSELGIEWWEGKSEMKIKCQDLSDELTDRILGRIRHLITT